MNNAKKIVIVDDHPPMAKGTKDIISEIQDVEVLGCAKNGQEAIEMVREYKPDLVLLDLNLPDINGKIVAEEIRAFNSGIHIIIYTGHDYLPIMNSLLNIGVSGFLSKDAEPLYLQTIVKLVLFHGLSVLPIPILRALRVDIEEYQPHFGESLTEREIELLALLSKGLTNGEIAKLIPCSEKTVEVHLSKIYKKLKVKNRQEAIERYRNIA